MFGCVVGVQTNGATTVDVQWYDGKLVTGIHPDNSLDKILDPVSIIIEGRIVQVDMNALGAPSAETSGSVVQMHRRDLNGGGAPTFDLVLMQCQNSGLYLEVPASICTPLLGR